jgi:hypothetical protein
MKTFCKYLLGIAIVMILVSNSSFRKYNVVADPLRGAWMHQSGNEEQVLLFVDGYSTHTMYSKSGKKFNETRGGTYTTNGNKLSIAYEFDTKVKEQTGQSLAYDFSIKNDELIITGNGKNLSYKRIDDGSAPLTGLWHITGRMQDGNMVPIHRTGTRKTIKILSGTRFQWAAIDPGTKQFSGPGGGTYEFANGKYTEHIEFFSRDGLSSKGDKIYEIWGRVKE